MVYAYLRGDGLNKMAEEEKINARVSAFMNICITNEEVEGVKMFLKINDLIKENQDAFSQLKTCISDYWKLEAEASSGTKFLMFINGWHSPFEACNELVKRIETNEQFIKNICKQKGTTLKEIGYKTIAKEANVLLNTIASKQPLDV